MLTAKCKALKALDRENLASQIAQFLNSLEDEVMKNAKIEVSTINAKNNEYIHFAYIIYFIESDEQ
jgi:hypothetical protein